MRLDPNQPAPALEESTEDYEVVYRVVCPGGESVSKIFFAEQDAESHCATSDRGHDCGGAHVVQCGIIRWED
jgi:hypothetical protein